MNIKLYFNFILLGLCLTTLFITLITYIIFRLRYSLKSKDSEGVHRMEGQFFRRFAPHLAKENQDKINKSKNKVTEKLSVKMKLSYMGGSVFLLIMAVLASEHFFVFRSELNQRAQSATNFRKLLDNGLLKSYEYKPHLKNPTLKEKISETERLQLKHIVSDLSKHKITIFSNENNQKKSVGHNRSIEKWESFFKRHNLKFSKVTRLYNGNDDSIWIIPNYERILLREKKAYEKHVLQGGKVFLTGAFGIYEEDDKDANHSWFEDMTELKVQNLGKQGKNRPSTFVSKGAPLWNLPPGLTLNLEVNNDKMTFLSNDENVKGYETDYESNLIQHSGLYGARYKIIDKYHRDSIWAQHDPVITKSENKIDEIVDISFYSDSIFLHSLNWISDNNIAKVSNWPKGKSFSSVLSIDAESKFKNIESLIRDLKEYKLPVTIFAVSDLYNEFPAAFDMLSKADDEVGSHSDDHMPMTDVSLFENFKRLQKSRLDIEQLYHKRVVGFRPPMEKYNEDTLNAISQNKFSYVFADQSHLRYSPVILSESELTFFPRIMNDDFAIRNNRLLSTAKKVSDSMSQDLLKVELFGGAYLFNMHTHIFGEQKFYQEGMKEFYKHLVKQDVWSTNFRDMSRWWKNKRDVSVEVESKNGEPIYLLVKNNGREVISDLYVEMRLRKLRKRHLATNSTDTNEKNIVKVKVDKIEPGKSLRLPID